MKRYLVSYTCAVDAEDRFEAEKLAKEMVINDDTVPYIEEVDDEEDFTD
jgi:hypothetical protein